MQFRQGDVFIEKVDGLPQDTKLKEAPRDSKGRIVLAFGEVTGHAHAIHETGVVALAEPRSIVDNLGDGFDLRDGVLYLQVPKGGATVVHEEHGQVKLDEGIYRVQRQREHSPQGDRAVWD